MLVSVKSKSSVNDCKSVSELKKEQFCQESLLFLLGKGGGGL